MSHTLRCLSKYCFLILQPKLGIYIRILIQACKASLRSIFFFIRNRKNIIKNKRKQVQKGTISPPHNVEFHPIPISPSSIKNLEGKKWVCRTANPHNVLMFGFWVNYTSAGQTAWMGHFFIIMYFFSNFYLYVCDITQK